MTNDNQAQKAIREECDALRDMLLRKNRDYGNSALDPVRIFSKASPMEQIRVRLDDKLSRLARGSAAGEDVELDLLGYLILMRVARKMGVEEDTPRGQAAERDAGRDQALRLDLTEALGLPHEGTIAEVRSWRELLARVEQLVARKEST